MHRCFQELSVPILSQMGHAPADLVGILDNNALIVAPIWPRAFPYDEV